MLHSCTCARAVCVSLHPLHWRGYICAVWILHLRLQLSIVFELSTISTNFKQWFEFDCISPGFFCANSAKAPSTSISDKCIGTPKPLYISGVARAHSILKPNRTTRLMTATSRFASKSGHRGSKGKRNTGLIVVLTELISYHGSTKICV